MYSLLTNRGIYNEAIKRYVVDEDDDIAKVPTDAPAGSECFVIGSSNTYMLNHKKQWIKVKLSSGGSSGGGGGDNPTPDVPSGSDIVYEGGEI